MQVDGQTVTTKIIGTFLQISLRVRQSSHYFAASYTSHSMFVSLFLEIVRPDNEKRFYNNKTQVHDKNQR
jgi:hypothetical protein